jgi:predicted porin
MKKSLLALAILGAFAGVASAQTNVTVYGLVDAGVTFEGGGAAGSVTKLATGVQSGNRLGFKGTEDLGGGLKANFQIESGFDLDTGTGRQGALFGRQAWVGLSGGFGAVGLGRQYTPLFIALDSVDPFGTGLAGATTNLMYAGPVRANNAITYSTPAMGGFSANVLYGLGEVAGNNSANRNIGLSVGYANGPVAIVLAHENQADATNTNKNKTTLLGGTYDFGVAKLHAGYEAEKLDAAGGDFRDVMVGVSAPIGAGTILASYIQKKDRASNSDRGGKQFALGYTYALSKRTNFYTAIAQIRNDSQGTNVVGDASSGGSAPAAGENSRAFNIGIRHKF